MTRPIYEPNTQRTEAFLDFNQQQLFRRPAPQPASSVNPWIAIFSGATTAPTDTWMPVPFGESVYDPALVTLGTIFDLDITDTGDPGNDRFRIITKVKGVFRAELTTFWDEVTTDGSNTHGYAVHNLFYGSGAPSSLTSITEYARASSDWPKNSTSGEFEMLDNVQLYTNQTIFSNTANYTWDPYGKQTTGIDRGLSGQRFYIEYMQYSASATWTYGSV